MGSNTREYTLLKTSLPKIPNIYEHTSKVVIPGSLPVGVSILSKNWLAKTVDELKLTSYVLDGPNALIS